MLPTATQVLALAQATPNSNWVPGTSWAGAMVVAEAGVIVALATSPSAATAVRANRFRPLDRPRRRLGDQVPP